MVIYKGKLRSGIICMNFITLPQLKSQKLNFYFVLLHKLVVVVKYLIFAPINASSMTLQSYCCYLREILQAFKMLFFPQSEDIW